MPMLWATDAATADGFGLFLLIVVLYFAPAVVAWRKRSFGSVMAINLFLGWTVVGWVVALAWALKDDPKPATVVVNPPPASVLCAACGRYAQAGAKFCPSCGVAL